MSAVDQEPGYELTHDLESLGGKNKRGLLLVTLYAILFWVVFTGGFSGILSKLWAWTMAPY